MSEKIVAWGLEDDERLSHSEMDDAIESVLDGIGDLNAPPETIEMCGFIHKKPSVKREATGALDRILESLDEEYGDPDGGYIEATDSMKDAAQEFVAAVLDEYTVWACEIVKRETVNVQEWIKENRPDWIGDNDKER